MAEICGVVEKVSYKDLNSGKRMWNIKVDGNWYGMGYTQPKFGEGGEIEFDISWNGDFANVDKDSLNIISAGNVRNSGGGNGGSRGGNGGGYNKSSGQQRSGGNSSNGGGYNRGSSGSSGNAGGAGKDNYWENKDKRDIEREKRDKVKDVVVTHLACRNSAIEAVGMLITAGAVSLPAKKAEQYDAVLELVDIVTERFVTGTREFTRATLAAAKTAGPKPAGAKPAPRKPEPQPEPEPEPEQEPDDGGDAPQDFDDTIPF